MENDPVVADCGYYKFLMSRPSGSSMPPCSLRGHNGGGGGGDDSDEDGDYNDNEDDEDNNKGDEENNGKT